MFNRLGRRYLIRMEDDFVWVPPPKETEAQRLEREQFEAEVHEAFSRDPQPQPDKELFVLRSTRDGRLLAASLGQTCWKLSPVV